MLTLGLVTLLVPDYDAALRFYVGVLGFELREDTRLDGEKRWVVVAPNPTAPTGFLLARAAGDRQRARVGDQTGGRVGFFLHSDDFAADHDRLLAAGVAFVEKPRVEAYGTVAVFEDPFGNRFDLIQVR